VQLELLVTVDLLDDWEQQVTLDSKVGQAQLDLQEAEVNQVALVPLDTLVQVVQQDPLELQELLALQVDRGLLDTLDDLDLLATQDNVDGLASALQH